MNVVLLAAVSTIYLPVPSSLYYMIAAASVAYVFVGPIVFMGPLLAFRGGMLRMKTELMSEVAQRLRRELTRIRAQITSGAISREDEDCSTGCARLARSSTSCRSGRSTPVR